MWVSIARAQYEMCFLTYVVIERVFEKHVMMGLVLLSLSLVSRLFVTPWTVAHQAPLSIVSPSKNTGVGSHFLLQGIFLTQGLNLHLLHCRHILLH